MLRVAPGPLLLSHLEDGPGYRAHRARFGDLPKLSRNDLVAAAEPVRGRGGAGFPFARKLQAVEHRRSPEIVVNWSEGEPASHKDAALARVRPHLVLDGVELVAKAFGTKIVHLVVPSEREDVTNAVLNAVGERAHPKRYRIHHATDRFVAGQARAVLELMAGRENLPVTAWQPEAYQGFRGRPTLLSNAETWAQLALRVLCPEGRPTTLLTFAGESAAALVVEAELGTRWGSVLPAELPDHEPLLLGGYHGAWTTVGWLRPRPIDHDLLRAAGLPLGAGVVLRVPHTECPVTMTARLMNYLAGQTAKRCGPCFNGLPELARAVSALAAGTDTQPRIRQLRDLVTGRGACAHPDGSARMVASMLARFPDEVAAHVGAQCGALPRAKAGVA